MTVATSCGVCAAALPAAQDVCPRCGTRVQHPDATMPTVLAGTLPAGRGSVVSAALIDALAVLPAVAVLVVGAVAGVAAWVTAGVVLVLMVLVALWSGLARTGAGLGGVVLGLRTVDTLTGLPVGPRAGVPTWGRDTVTLDVRHGRDPLQDLARPEATRPTVAPDPVAATQVSPRHREHPVSPPEGSPLDGWARGPDTPAAGWARGPDTPAAGWAPTMPPARATPSTPVEPLPVIGAPASFGASPVAPTVTGVSLTDSDGHRIEVSGSTLVGRNPEPAPGETTDALASLIDLTRSVSKTHASLRWDGSTLWLADRGSTNGTSVSVGGGPRTPVPPGGEVAVAVGTTVHFGERTFVVEGPLGGL